jgi:predicted metal-dependent hydrolase
MLAYTIKESARVKHVRLQVSPVKGVIVTAPPGFSRTRIAAFVAARQDWINKQLQRFAARCTTAPPQEFPPAQLHLRAIQQTWHMRYAPAPGKLTPQEIAPGELWLGGEMSALKNFFHDWLARQARLHFQAKLEHLAHLSDVSYQKLTIKCQKTRWGSCSRQGNINLNYKLLFLPPAQMRYVLLHELAHLRHFNHSAAFWQLLQNWEPDCRRLDKALNDGWCYVPTWL